VGVVNFDTAFANLTGNSPFPWQRDLFQTWFSKGIFPDACILPTGLGKTAVVAIWLIALAEAPDRVPRRLVYVVNRRTVVDQTTNEAEKIRRSAADVGVPTPAISTLRGQFADNREWSADPSRPAIIVGTVDMIGSRLLFSGYGCGFKSRPLHAGFLGQDALLIHDEAHLEPAFQKLIETIVCEQRGGRCNELGPCGLASNRPVDFRPLRVMALTATPRGSGTLFELSDRDRAEPEVRKRIEAKKAICLHENKDEKKLAEEIADLALKHESSDRAILVFVRKVEDVEGVVKKLPKDSFEPLTGTMRGLERDRMADPRKINGSPIFARFLKPPKEDAPESERWKVEPKPGTVYLVCTSAGEVGVNISADHMVCDLSTFDSMAQRLGRVNRFGDRDDTRIDVMYPKKFTENELEARRKKTLDLLGQLHGDGSPTALGALNPESRVAAFAPPPMILPATDILFDAWALTTIRDKLPARPPVERYLHGISDYEPPQTSVAWREEVAELTPAVLEYNRLDIEGILEAYPLKPHEVLTAPTDGKNKVFEQLQKIAQRDSERPQADRLFGWVIDSYGRASRYSLQVLVEKNSLNRPVVALAGATVLLPPHAGGLSGGLLKGDEPYSESIRYDVSGEWYDPETKTSRRIRVWDNDPDFEQKRKGRRLICRIDIPAPEDDDNAEPRKWHWLTLPASADDDGSNASRLAISWQRHTDDVVAETTRLANAMFAGHPELRDALILAARCHDHGKRRDLWQKDIGNDNYRAECYAKSGQLSKGGQLRPRNIISFRHEFASLIDTLKERDFQALADRPELQQLVLHLIAAHHGYARPHFPADLAFDPEHGDTDAIAAEVPERFARLQRKYGRWGLAYLESLLRAADWHASANPSKDEES
jgi:CRISPR-associated endonuclease/helicase Cas3